MFNPTTNSTIQFQNAYSVPGPSYHNTAIFVGGIIGFLLVAFAFIFFLCRMRGSTRRHSTVELLPRPLVLPTHINTSTTRTATDKPTTPVSQLPSPVLPRDLVKQLCTLSPTSSVTFSAGSSSPLFTPKIPESSVQVLSIHSSSSPVSPTFVPATWMEEQQQIEGRSYLGSGSDHKVLSSASTSACTSPSTEAPPRIPESYSFEFRCRGEGRFSSDDDISVEDLMIISTAASTPEIQNHKKVTAVHTSKDPQEIRIGSPSRSSLAARRRSPSAPVLGGFSSPKTKNSSSPMKSSVFGRSNVRKSPTSPTVATVPHHRDLTPAKSCLKIKPSVTSLAEPSTVDNFDTAESQKSNTSVLVVHKSIPDLITGTAKSGESLTKANSLGRGYGSKTVKFSVVAHTRSESLPVGHRAKGKQAMINTPSSSLSSPELRGLGLVL